MREPRTKKRRTLYLFGLIIILALLWYQNAQQKALLNEVAAREVASTTALQINAQTKINEYQDAYNLVRLGLFLQEAGQQELALASMQKAVELEPNWRDGYWSLAVAYLHWANSINPTNKQEAQEYQERITGAKESLKQCLALDPGFLEAREILKKLEG